MFVGQGPTRRRVFIEDSRRDGAFLRVTWHPEGGQFVVSTWADEVCTGAVRVPAAEAAPLIGLLADGLADAAGAPVARVEPAEPSRTTALFDRLRALAARVRRRRSSEAPAALPEAPTARVTWRRSA
jgi:hypothetical protein